MLEEKPIRVLILASGYPLSREDNSSIFLRYLASKLSQRGIKTHVLAPAHQDKWGETAIEDQVHVHRFQYLPARLQKLAYGSGILPNLRHNPWLWLEVPFFIATMAISLLRFVKKEHPDLIHAHWVLPQGLVAILVKPLTRVPIITTVHGSDAFRLKWRWVRWLKRLVLLTSDAWTANSRATSKVIGEETAIPNCSLIPMGVDVRRFQSGQRASLRAALSENQFIILFVGRLVKEKGLDDLFEALTLLPSDLRSNISLWVVGDGNYRTKLEAYAQRLFSKETVRFWGQISNDLLPDIYASSDLFVAPSSHDEGQGVVLLEAFAAQVCAVATRVGGIPDVVENGHTGLLVESRDPKGLARAIETLLRDKELRKKLADNAHAKVKKIYDWEKIAQDFEKLYRDVLSRK